MKPKLITITKKIFLAFTVLGFFMAILILEIMDKHPYCGDASEYGLQAVKLSYSLLHTPESWISDMVRVMPNKPPGIIWLGQFFVPLGTCLGSIDKALLLSISIILTLSAFLTYIAIDRIEDSCSCNAFSGMLFLMSSPMLLTSSFTFLTEPFQLFCVTIFIFLMTVSIRADRKLSIILLTGAAALLLSSKINSAAYCITPALYSMYQAFKNKSVSNILSIKSTTSLISIPIIVVLLAFVTIWYAINLPTAYQHLKLSYAGDIAAIWGVKASFKQTLAYWIRVCGTELMLPSVAGLAIGYFIIALLSRAWKGPKRLNLLDVFLICSIIQIGIVLIMCGMASNRSTRFLIPLIPYFSIIIAWAIRWMPIKILRVTFVVYLACVLVFELISMSNINFGGFKAQFPVRRVFTQQREIQLLSDIINKTQSDKPAENNGSIVAIDPLLKGDWLASAPLNYYAFCHSKNHPNTTYYCAGGGFFGSTGEEAIRIMKSEMINNVVIADPDIYSPLTNYINNSLRRGEVEKIMKYLKESGVFTPAGPIGEDKGILLFKKYQKASN